LSGKLATDACRNAVEVDADGKVTQRSMVYTEYFVHGTEPLDYCPIHSNLSHALTTLATTGTLGEPSPPPPAANHAPAAAPAAAAAPAQTSPANEAAAEKPQEKKRGFWSRIFGRGDDKKNDDKNRDERRR
jgi:hypothetical protein